METCNQVRISRPVPIRLRDPKGFPLFRQGVDEHGGTRTPDPQNRNLMLYPTELHAPIRLAPVIDPSQAYA